MSWIPRHFLARAGVLPNVGGGWGEGDGASETCPSSSSPAYLISMLKINTTVLAKCFTYITVSICNNSYELVSVKEFSLLILPTLHTHICYPDGRGLGTRTRE